MHVGRLAPVLVAAVSLGACHPKPLRNAEIFGGDARPMRTLERLTCPEHVQRLLRTAETGDGRSCTYTGPQTEEVQLSLTPLDGQTPDARLAALDATLKGEVPAAVSADHGPGVYIGSDKGADQAHIDLPGFHLNASGDKASIHMPGVNIDADNDKAQVSTGFGDRHQAVVNAHDGGAEIRAGGVGPNGTDVTYLLASDSAGPSGYMAVGYVAKGPSSGPLVVGVFRAREHHGHAEGGEDGLDRLVDMNVHG